MGRACNTHGKEGEEIHWSEDLKGGDQSEDLGVGGKIISEWILGK
jgi:hypothetical protein